MKIINMGYIYNIVNLVNNKKYVGKTVNPRVRKSKHFTELRNNEHYNEHLQNAWNKYGEENFKYELIEECEDWEMGIREGYWANKLNTYDSNFGYNIAGIDDAGAERTEEHKAKIQESLVKANLEKLGRVVLIDLVSREVQYFNSLQELKQLGININRKLNMKTKTYWNHESKLPVIDSKFFEHHLEKCKYLDENPKTPKPLYCFSVDTRELVHVFTSITSAIKSKHVPDAVVRNILNPNTGHYLFNGYTYSLTPEFPEKKVIPRKRRKDFKNINGNPKDIRKTPIIRYEITNGTATYQAKFLKDFTECVENTTKKGWEKLSNGQKKSYMGYKLTRL